MKANVEKIENNRVRLKVEIDAEQVNKTLDRAYRKLVKEINVPGFRKGKAPRKILENHIGTQPIFEEALDFILPDAYAEAVKEAEVHPIDRPEIEVEQFEEDKPLVFVANVEIKPEVELGDYRSISVEKPPVEVSDEDVQKSLETLQKRYAKMITVPDAEVENGDVVLIDYKGYMDGETFSGGIEDDYVLEIGSGTFIPGFEDQLLGAKAGESKDVNVTFPEDYREESLAGKEATFKVTVKEIKRREYSELDDEFAKDISEFDTLEELKNDIRSSLEKSAQKKANQDLREEVVKEVVDKCKVEVPETLVTRRIDAHMKRLADRLEAQGYNLEQYCEAAGTTEEEIREKYREQSVRSVKTDLVLEEIALKEKIDIAEEEVLQEIQQLAKEYNENAEDVQQTLRSRDNLEGLTYGLLMDKTVQFLVDNSTSKESAEEG